MRRDDIEDMELQGDDTEERTKKAGQMITPLKGWNYTFLYVYNFDLI